MHEFRRPDTLPDSRMVGERWSEDQARYDEGVRYVYRHGAHNGFRVLGDLGRRYQRAVGSH